VEYGQAQKRPIIWIWLQLLWAFGYFAFQEWSFAPRIVQILGLLPSPRLLVLFRKASISTEFREEFRSSSGGTISILGNSTRQLRFKCTEVRKTPRVSMHWNEGLNNPTALQNWPRACRCAFWKSGGALSSQCTLSARLLSTNREHELSTHELSVHGWGVEPPEGPFQGPLLGVSGRLSCGAMENELPGCGQW